MNFECILLYVFIFDVIMFHCICFTMYMSVCVCMYVHMHTHVDRSVIVCNPLVCAFYVTGAGVVESRGNVSLVHCCL